MDFSKDTANKHPSQICLKCYSKLNNTIKRGSTPTIKFYNFETGSPKVCLLCKPFYQQKSKDKLSSLGRQKAGKEVWGKNKSNKLLKSAFPDYEHNKSVMENVVTEHLPPKFLDCHECESIMDRPIVLLPCEHSFCVLCILKRLEGQVLENITCPTCGTFISSLHPSTKLFNVIKDLKLRCGKCDLEYIEGQHDCGKGSSSSSQTTVSDLMNISTEEEISKEINDAVVHVIKTKFKHSDPLNNSILLQTGGRVSIFLKIPFYI